MDKPTLMVFDGNNAMIRAHFAMARRDEAGNFETLKTRDGRESGAVFGCIQNFLTLCSMFKPTHVLWTFDGGRSKARLAIRPEYKANRNSTGKANPYSAAETDFGPSFAAFNEFLDILGIRRLRQTGVEADDIISASTVLADQADMIIVSQDHDLLQLVSPNIIVYKAGSKTTLDSVLGPEEVYAKYGCRPDQLAKMWAITGDAGDNVIGVKGIGEKTAHKILTQYGWDLETCAYSHPKIASVGASRLVMENYQLIKLNRVFASFDVTLDECEFNPHVNSDLLMEWLEDWEMFSLVAKLAKGELFA